MCLLRRSTTHLHRVEHSGQSRQVVLLWKREIHLVDGCWQVAVALDALDVVQVVVALHQGLVVRLLAALPRHQAAQLLTGVGLHFQDCHDCDTLQELLVAEGIHGHDTG